MPKVYLPLSLEKSKEWKNKSRKKFFCLAASDSKNYFFSVERKIWFQIWQNWNWPRLDWFGRGRLTSGILPNQQGEGMALNDKNIFLKLFINKKHSQTLYEETINECSNFELQEMPKGKYQLWVGFGQANSQLTLNKTSILCFYRSIFLIKRILLNWMRAQN